MQTETKKFPGKGKGRVVSNEREDVNATQFQVRLGKNTIVPTKLDFIESAILVLQYNETSARLSAYCGSVSGRTCRTYTVIPLWKKQVYGRSTTKAFGLCLAFIRICLPNCNVANT